jgi:hypothetical protein
MISDSKYIQRGARVRRFGREGDVIVGGFIEIVVETADGVERWRVRDTELRDDWVGRPYGGMGSQP